MRHLHIPSFPGRHRSGFFFILLLIFLVFGNLRTEEALKAAMDRYFAAHPHFHPRDYNEKKVRKLVKTHLDYPRSHYPRYEVEDSNSHELPCLMGAMDEEPLYEQFLEKMREQEQFWEQPSRKRSRSRSATSKPKCKLTAKAKYAPKLMPKGSVKFEVPAPHWWQSAASGSAASGSAASSSGSSGSLLTPKGSVKFEVPGPQSTASGSGSSGSPSSEVPGPESTDTSS